MADDVAVGSAVVGSDQMPEIQAAKKFEAEKPVEPGVLGLVPGWIWLAIVAILVVFFAFFVEPQPFRSAPDLTGACPSPLSGSTRVPSGTGTNRTRPDLSSATTRLLGTGRYSM